MAKAYAFTQRTANRLLEIAGEVGRYTEPGRSRQKNDDVTRPILVRNDSGEEIPGFACLQVTGAADDLGYCTTVTKCNGDGRQFVFNGPYPIEVDGFGTAYAGYVRAKYAGTETPAVNETWGPREGEWFVYHDGQPAIGVFGITDATASVLSGMSSPIRSAMQFFKVPQDVSAPADPLFPTLVSDCVRMDIDSTTGELVETTEYADVYFRFCCPTDTYVEVVQIDGLLFATGRHRGDEFGELTVADVQYILGIDSTGCVGKVGTTECAPTGIQTISSGSSLNSNLGSYFDITGGSSPYSISGDNSVVQVLNSTGGNITVEGLTITDGNRATFVNDGTGTESFDAFGDEFGVPI